MATDKLFSREITFDYGVAMALSPLVRRFVARNPGPYTFKGTNVYIVGRKNIAVIDPGPADEDHVAELLKAIEGATVTHIFLTHTHKDHSGAVQMLKQQTGAITCAYQPQEGTRRGMYSDESALRDGFADMAFKPDLPLADGDVVEGADWQLQALHTPGHAPDHVCYALPAEQALFTGDHIMPWSTTIIAPPEGNMGAYMASLSRLAKRSDELFFPDHGGRVNAPRKLIKAYILHRQWRETSIMGALADGHQRVETILPLIYKDLEAALKPAAALSILAHLEHLQEKGHAKRLAGTGLAAQFGPA
jgi:glyoxylase-like metal-dependent hydrolase (beta-lactamase superfamily II)